MSMYNIDEKPAASRPTSRLAVKAAGFAFSFAVGTAGGCGSLMAANDNNVAPHPQPPPVAAANDNKVVGDTFPIIADCKKRGLLWNNTVAYMLATVKLGGDCIVGHAHAPAAAVPPAKKGADVGDSLQLVGNFKPGVDPRLMNILDVAAKRTAKYRVEAFSGFRPGDRRFHGKRIAVDIRLVNPATGKELPNYQDAGSFREYEKFAQTVRRVQMELYPDLAEELRWGGYFSGKKGKYGAMDLMHFDLGGAYLGMGGGSWENGLTKSQRAIFPDAKSVGMDP